VTNLRSGADDSLTKLPDAGVHSRCAWLRHAAYSSTPFADIPLTGVMVYTDNSNQK